MIFFYTKTDDYIFNPTFIPYTEDYLKSFFKYTEKHGRRYRLISMIGPGGAAKGNPRYEFLGVTKYWRYSQARMNELYKASQGMCRHVSNTSTTREGCRASRSGQTYIR